MFLHPFYQLGGKTKMSEKLPFMYLEGSFFLSEVGQSKIKVNKLDGERKYMMVCGPDVFACWRDTLSFLIVILE